MKFVRQLLYIQCDQCKVWIIAGKGAAALAYGRMDLKRAAVEAGWKLDSSVLCPACLKENDSHA